MKTLIVDPSRCLQCSNCWVACKDEHCDNDWSPIAAKQGEDQWWIRVEEHEAASGAHMRLHRVPVMCMHCAEAPCMDACANGAITRRADGIILISPEGCKGCFACVAACPYDAVFANAEARVAQKCTLCAHLLDAGWDRPRCVTACPADALRFVDEAELAPERLYAPLERLKGELGTRPQVAYVRLPRLFIAGELAADGRKSCVEGAFVRVIHQVSGESYEGVSGTFGDFHIDVDGPGCYGVEIFADGYKRRALTDIMLDASLSLGVIDLYAMTT
jgi:Fe-S-cluster-containing dehydrogenase component